MEAYLPNNCFRNAVLDPEAIVIHFFSLRFVEKDDHFNMKNNWFLMNDLNLPKSFRFKYLLKKTDPDKRLYASAHVLIGRDGERLITVPENRQAYHAGDSMLFGRKDWNSFSLGVELLGSPTSGFTEKQYIDCANYCAGQMRAYPKITLKMIVGHDEITQHRIKPKRDPGIASGNFDMVKLKNMIKLALEL